MSIPTSRDHDLREQAIERLDARRGFLIHLTAYLVINTVLVAVWFLTSEGGLFWPVFPMLGWGIGLVFHGMEALRLPHGEDRIRQEMDRLADGTR